MDSNTPVDKLQQMVSDNAANRLEMLKKGFAELNRINVRSIPEIIFTTHFLPVFCGEVADDNKEMLARWITIAGTSYDPVNIVDSNGKIIIQVPPIYDVGILQPNAKRENNLTNAFKVAKEKESLSPMLSSNIIANELSSSYDNLLENGHINPEFEKQWINLFKHYGKVVKNANTTQTNVSDEDEFEY